MNNNQNVIIDKSFNEVILSFKSREVMISINIDKMFTVVSNSKSIFEENRFVYRKKVVDVIFFVVAKIKIVYDNRHQFLRFRFDEKTYLRLHHEYSLSFKFNRKLFNQRIDSFRIKKKMKRLVYELKLSFK